MRCSKTNWNQMMHIIFLIRNFSIYLIHGFKITEFIGRPNFFFIWTASSSIENSPSAVRAPCVTERSGHYEHCYFLYGKVRTLLGVRDIFKIVMPLFQTFLHLRSQIKGRFYVVLRMLWFKTNGSNLKNCETHYRGKEFLLLTTKHCTTFRIDYFVISSNF